MSLVFLLYLKNALHHQNFRLYVMNSRNWYDMSYAEKYHLVHKILAISQLKREVTMKI